MKKGFLSMDIRLPVILSAVLFFFGACSTPDPDASSIWQLYRQSEGLPGLEIQHPFDGALFPMEVPAPLVVWNQAPQACDSWVLALSVGDEPPCFLDKVNGSGIHLPEEDWEMIREKAGRSDVTLSLVGYSSEEPGEILASGTVSFAFSADPVEAPLFYREVNLPFIDAVKDPSRIRWRCGTVGSRQPPPVVLEDLPVCGNCHSFSSDGKVLGMDVDYANDKGSYAVVEVQPHIDLTQKNIFSWAESSAGKNDKTFGLLSQVSPCGRYVISTVRDRSVFVPKEDLEYSQLFFPLKGVLAVYDRKEDRFFDLPGASDSRFVQSNPSWSPDGKYIVFARAEAYELKTLDDQGQVLLTPADCAEFLVEGKEFKFDLYRIPFNNGRGGEAEPLEGASRNGLSNYFAKFSPDGKWIVFCQANSFMLLQPDSRLMIIPAQGGQPREVACNTGNMNSWHTWSPDGRWLVFSSKAFSPYTQLMIAHFDSEGRSAAPVLLDRLTTRRRAANIPEFLASDGSGIQKIAANFIDDLSFYRAGLEASRSGDLVKAEAMYRKALEMNWDNKAAHVMLGSLLGERGDYDEAISHLQEAIRVDPRLIEAHNNLAYVYMWKGDREKALAGFARAVELNPRMIEAYIGMGVLNLEIGDYELAEKRFRSALGVLGTSRAALIGLAKSLRHQGRKEEALRVIVRVLDIEPGNVEALLETGELLLGLNRPGEAAMQFNKVISLDPGNARALAGLNRTRPGS